jgi:hypothetical protein
MNYDFLFVDLYDVYLYANILCTANEPKRHTHTQAFMHKTTITLQHQMHEGAIWPSLSIIRIRGLLDKSTNA